MKSAGLAALLTFGCVWASAAGGVVSTQRLTPAAGRERSGRAAMLRAGAGAGVLVLAVLTLWHGGGRALFLAGLSSAVVVAVHRLLDGARRRRMRGRRSSAVIELCDALPAELRAGLPAMLAIERAVGAWPSWSPIVTVARLGGDVPAALRAASEESGAEGLRAVAAAWQVAEQSGAALADVLDRVADGLRSDDDARSEVVAALAPPRATAKMLAALPILGLGLGYSMNADPLDFLLHTTAGLGCLGAGVGLALVGLWWVERLADAVED